MKNYKVYYTHTKQSAVIVKANSQEEAEEKFWEFDVVEGTNEDIINTEDDRFIQEIEELPKETDKANVGDMSYRECSEAVLHKVDY